jgi:hypothetical protein
MDQVTQIIKKVGAYAKSMGLETSTVCGYATGNKRLLSRLERRAERTKNDIQRLEAYMAANPPGGSTRANS